MDPSPPRNKAHETKSAEEPDLYKKPAQEGRALEDAKTTKKRQCTPQAPEGGKAGRGQESSTTGAAYLCELCTSAMVRLVRQALRRASGE